MPEKPSKLGRRLRDSAANPLPLGKPAKATVPKKRRKGAGKGSSFERDVCRLLTAWWIRDPNDPERFGNLDQVDVIFWRTSQSGGRATTRRKTGRATASAHCGDLAAIDPMGKPFADLITTEIKRGYGRATIHDLLDRPAKAAEQTYEEWIEQAKRSSEEAGTPYWAIIHRRDRREAIIAVPNTLIKALSMRGFSSSITVDLSVEDGRRLRIVAMPLAAFLEAVAPAAIRNLARHSTEVL